MYEARSGVSKYTLWTTFSGNAPSGAHRASSDAATNGASREAPMNLTSWRAGEACHVSAGSDHGWSERNRIGRAERPRRSPAGAPGLFARQTLEYRDRAVKQDTARRRSPPVPAAHRLAEGATRRRRTASRPRP